MAQGEDKTTRTMTPRAAAAFAVYAGLGPSRTLRKAAEIVGRTDQQVQKWSSDYGWPARIARVEEAEAVAALRRIARKKLLIHERTLDEYDRRTAEPMIAAMPLGAIHPIHDRTKPPEIAAAEQAPASITLTIVEREDGPR